MTWVRGEARELGEGRVGEQEGDNDIGDDRNHSFTHIHHHNQFNPIR